MSLKASEEIRAVSNDSLTSQRHVVLQDRETGPCTFDGVLLARASSEEQSGKRHRRWTELEIYRRADGAYVAYQVGKSRMPNEVDWGTVVICADARAVLAAFTVDGVVPAIASDVVDDASLRDEVFARELGDVHEVEDLTGAIGSGREFVLDRDGRRALRFNGEILAEASSRHGDAPRWTEITIFLTGDGRYVVSKRLQSVFDDEPVRARVRISNDGMGIVRALARPADGRLERAAMMAVRRAAARDARLNASVSDFLKRDAADEGDPLPAPRLHPTRRDSRHRYLELLDAGARILTSVQDDSEDLDFVRWASSANVPADQPPPKRVFRALQRQELVEVVSTGLSPGSRSDTKLEEWGISALGRKVLAEAR